MSLDDDGILRFDVSSKSTPDGPPEGSSPAGMHPILMAYIVFLMMVYIAVKLFLPSLAPLSSPEQQGMDEGDGGFSGVGDVVSTNAEFEF